MLWQLAAIAKTAMSVNESLLEMMSITEEADTDDILENPDAQQALIKQFAGKRIDHLCDGKDDGER
ncbi:hypothetical protein [Paenibacillus senegalensis]|uniref:hypothetical protein n=1 Tax=Paenibacillus senegalensis TaxID=1465766 RepID=UPI000288E4FC|nr:hypothetical protein [Paenibacillus senegalensis]